MHKIMAETMECPHTASKPRGYLQKVLNDRVVNIIPNNAADLFKNNPLLPEKYLRSQYINRVSTEVKGTFQSELAKKKKGGGA